MAPRAAAQWGPDTSGAPSAPGARSFPASTPATVSLRVAPRGGIISVYGDWGSIMRNCRLVDFIRSVVRNGRAHPCGTTGLVGLCISAAVAVGQEAQPPSNNAPPQRLADASPGEVQEV